MNERDFLLKQLAASEQQMRSAQATVEQCRGAIQLCRGRLTMLERLERAESTPAEGVEEPSSRISPGSNGEVE